jgi:hypothetical protein
VGRIIRQSFSIMNGRTDKGEGGYRLHFTNWPTWTCAFLVCSAAFLFRVWIILRGVTVSPDGREYMSIAANLIRNACYSSSDPGSAMCEPTWSHHPPGYPLFLASVMSVAGPSPMIIVVAQTVLFCSSLWYLIWSAAKLNVKKKYLVLMGLAVGLSPVTAGWSSWVLTETLSAAACLWLLAECTNAVAVRHVSVSRFAFAITVCALLRWDMVWVAIPFMAVTWWIYQEPKKAISVIASVGVLSVAPYLLWVARAAMVGLPLIPPTIPSLEDVPQGVQEFWKVTSVKQGSVLSLVWPAWNRQYLQIESNYRADSVMEPSGKHVAPQLLRTLAMIPDGEPVPPQIDRLFATSAKQYRNQSPLYRAKVYIMRMYYMWSEPDTLYNDGYSRDRIGGRLAGAAIAARELYLLLAICSLLWVRNTDARILIAAVLLMNLVRTIFLVSMTALEIRYLATCLPSLEYVAIAFLGARNLNAQTPSA